MGLEDAIAALEVAPRGEARGEALNMTKALLQYGKSSSAESLWSSVS